MRWSCLCFLLAASVINLSAQGFGSSVAIVTVYSQNEKFYLRSIPYDNEFPSLRGKTYVYQTGNATPLYVFDRGFDSVDAESNNLTLSNDGEVIFYLIQSYASDETEGLKSVNIYRRGKIVESFTEAEITGCDYKKERCDLLYNNYKEVVDEKASNWGTKAYKKVLKQGVSEQERFLSDFALFAFDDTVYLVDSKRKVHSFNLADGSRLASAQFEKVFEELRSKGRFNKVKLERYSNSISIDFPNLKNGQDTQQNLASYLGMKPVDPSDKKDEQYKQYRIRIDCFVLQDGSVEIENIESPDGLPTDKIREFFKSHKFAGLTISKEFDKWYFGNTDFTFRNSNDTIARRERKQQLAEQRIVYQKRLTAESIEGRYIPKDLGECLIELDKMLTEVNINEMKALPKRGDMIEYHMGLGMWMRNNWGLWGGSRLQKYFEDKGITHPDDMSSVVLFYYYDWLKGDKGSWKEWDKNPKSPFE